jgi:hypothetical protein
LYVDKYQIDEFARNTSYYGEFKCENDESETCVSVSQSLTEAQIIFSTGLTISLEISKLKINDFQGRGWLSFSINFPTNFTSGLLGLLGNNNDYANDDIQTRNGQLVSDLTNDSAIYWTMVSWTLNSDDVDLFVDSSEAHLNTRLHTDYAFTRLSRQLARTYVPSFVNQSNVAPDIKEKCKNQTSCITDAVLSGSLSAGLDTLTRAYEYHSVVKLLNNQPPIIQFVNTSVEIDWSQAKSQLTLVATISCTQDCTGSFNIENATKYATKIVKINSTYLLAQIVYTINRDEYPQFGYFN